MNKTDRLLAKYPIISDQVDAKELGVLLRELEKVLQSGATGNIVEFRPEFQKGRTKTADHSQGLVC